MKVLSETEIQNVSGAGILEAWEGFLDGAMTGALLAGKSAGAGGLVVGAIGQLVGTIIGGIAGGVGLGLYGLTHTSREVAAYAKHYRDTVGIASTSVGGSL